MVRTHHGEFSVDFDPHAQSYHLIQQLPSDGNTYAAASLATEKVLSIADNEIEQRHIFHDITCDNQAVPSAFSRAIPGVEFRDYSISVPVRSELGLDSISLELHDKRKPAHTITVKPELGAGASADLLVIDNHPNREPKSAARIGREAVRHFLAWQLQELAPEGSAFTGSTAQQLGMLLGQYALGPRSFIRTAETSLRDPTQVLHAEKEETFAGPKSTTGEITHSLWLTKQLSSDVLQYGQEFRARTVARIDARDFWNPGNSLNFEVEASGVDIDDVEELTRQVTMLQRSRRAHTARAFVACLRDYLLSNRTP